MKVSVLDVLILIAVVLAVYLGYVYLSNEASENSLVEQPVLANTNVNGDNKSMLLEENTNNDSINGLVNEVANEVVNEVLNEPIGREKLRAANKKGDHVLLDQKDVKDKSEYICNKECPCDERTIGESLEDIRKQFLSPSESFYGNVNRSFGVSLEEGFKAHDGNEYLCQLPKMDEDFVNSLLGCKTQNNLNLNLNLSKNRNNNQSNNQLNNNQSNNQLNNQQ